jgi:hypothetical protein
MFEIQFVGMRSPAFRLGKGVGLLRPRSSVTRLINDSRGTTTTTTRSRGSEREKESIWHSVQKKDFILLERRCEAIGNDWNATRIWRQPRRPQDCAWAPMSHPAARGHRHRDVVHLVAHRRTGTQKIQVRLARSGDSVRSTRQPYSQNRQFTTGGSPEP